MRQALRRIGDLIRIAEARSSSEVMSCAPSCPIKEGFVERDGVKLHYEVYGDGPQTMVFLPPWSIVHSRVYKAQLPYFSERFRCITYDGRGNGKSDRPDEAAAYSLDNYVGRRARRDGRHRCRQGDPGRPVARRHASPACWRRTIPSA